MIKPGEPITQDAKWLTVRFGCRQTAPCRGLAQTHAHPPQRMSERSEVHCSVSLFACAATPRPKWAAITL